MKNESPTTPEVPVESGDLFESCEAVGRCPRPARSHGLHDFYVDWDRELEMTERIWGEGGNGHDDPLSGYSAVICSRCGREALVNHESDDWPAI